VGTMGAAGSPGPAGWLKASATQPVRAVPLSFHASRGPPPAAGRLAAVVLARSATGSRTTGLGLAGAGVKLLTPLEALDAAEAREEGTAEGFSEALSGARCRGAVEGVLGDWRMLVIGLAPGEG
jgi:hypothetical protein